MIKIKRKRDNSNLIQNSKIFEIHELDNNIDRSALLQEQSRESAVEIINSSLLPNFDSNSQVSTNFETSHRFDVEQQQYINVDNGYFVNVENQIINTNHTESIDFDEYTHAQASQNIDEQIVDISLGDGLEEKVLEYNTSDVSNDFDTILDSDIVVESLSNNNKENIQSDITKVIDENIDKKLVVKASIDINNSIKKHKSTIKLIAFIVAIVAIIAIVIAVGLYFIDNSQTNSAISTIDNILRYDSLIARNCDLQIF
ncbi:MAG: hypothetical protein FWF56_04695 [Firmicutes bacterium]|nr:hypothetical protein [Bacillota bacterium]MCL1953206.1 hypothetical protein [Bacillota bacterium]